MLDNLPRGTICIEEMEIGMSRYVLKTIRDETCRGCDICQPVEAFDRKA